MPNDSVSRYAATDESDEGPHLQLDSVESQGIEHLEPQSAEDSTATERPNQKKAIRKPTIVKHSRKRKAIASTNEYEVESIDDVRVSGGIHEYLIKGLGYA